ncbi:hypothetical protein DESC_910054 [Desulfosarcina cetonica]|nr:hypothetical protein DESC_910054 [Desulfosarcina cetonica]
MPARVIFASSLLHPPKPIGPHRPMATQRLTDEHPGSSVRNPMPWPPKNHKYRLLW